MRLLHTSDWHLGHTLREVTREYEHASFLSWLLETCAREAPDVVVITGDVFDSATPPASAERMWFEFLAALKREVVVIAGNHDSPARLGASSSVLRELGVHVVGGLPRLGGGGIDLDRVLIPVAGGRGLVAAVPFLRATDVVGEGDDDPMARIYGEVIAGARARRRADQVLIVLGHLYAAGSAPSASERRVSIGGVEAASPRLFPADIDYVALGHMHRAQRIWRDSIRYAGSPIPLSFDEAPYRHGVMVVDFDGGRVSGMRALEIPRAVQLVRVRGSMAAVLAELDGLERVGELVDPTRPFLEVIVTLARPEPRLRTLVETALDGKRARLVRLAVEGTGDGGALAERTSSRRLAEIDPRDVFLQCWAKGHAEPPSASVVGAFDRLLVEVGGDEALAAEVS